MALGKDNKKELDEKKKLELILEAVEYCKKVKDMGMPRSCYAKALREPIFFLWERKNGMTKYDSSQFWSAAAKAEIAEKVQPFEKPQLIYDHAIPFKYVFDKLLGLESVDIDSVRECLNKYLCSCTITREEDKKLNEKGFRQRMPEDWDGINPLSRYERADIKICEVKK